MHKRRVEQLTGQARRLTGREDEFFKTYVRTQLDDTLHFIHGQVFRPIVMQRTVYLTDLMDRLLPGSREDLRLLCLGCRNSQELDYIEETCRIKHIEGLDLFGEDPRIKVGDMHQMPFSDDTFDVLYACHSLEHAYDLDRVLAECIRVIKSGGMLVIEVPINYRITETDRWDVGSGAKLAARLDRTVEEVLFAEDTTDVARLIIRIRKPTPRGSEGRCAVGLAA